MDDYDAEDIWMGICQFVTNLLICAGLWWVTCWAFGHPFELKEFLGVCTLMMITKGFLG